VAVVVEAAAGLRPQRHLALVAGVAAQVAAQ